MVAYSSVSHMGFCVLGLFALNAAGLNGGLLQMINHGLSTGALFLLVGMIYERRHTREIALLGGLAKPLPVYAAFFLIVTLSSIGLPGLNGFVGEFLVLLGAFRAHPWAASLATTGVILAAVYMLWMVQRVFFGPEKAEYKDFPEVDAREVTVLTPLTIMAILLGVLPTVFFFVFTNQTVSAMFKLFDHAQRVAGL